MLEPLNAVEVRVVGALIEKESTTPDNYPLTLNALVAACNQSTNREPVMDLQESEVARSIEELGRRTFVRALHRSDSRVLRYRQSFSETMHLHPAELAVMGVLMLRGAQTAGEIRTRSARLYEFRDIAHLEVTLNALMTLSTPLVVELPRRPGQKEARFMHLLSGEPVIEADEPHAQREARPDRITALEETVAVLQAEVLELRAQLEEFRKEFQ